MRQARSDVSVVRVAAMRPCRAQREHSLAIERVLREPLHGASILVHWPRVVCPFRLPHRTRDRAAPSRARNVRVASRQRSRERSTSGKPKRQSRFVGQSRGQLRRPRRIVVAMSTNVTRSRGKVGRPPGKVGRSPGKVGRSGWQVGRSRGKMGRASLQLGCSAGKVSRAPRQIGRSRRKVKRTSRQLRSS